jgi:hypothetical protein
MTAARLLLHPLAKPALFLAALLPSDVTRRMRMPEALSAVTVAPSV